MQDQKAIGYKFNKSVADMTANGQRLENPYKNNAKSTVQQLGEALGVSKGGHLFGCGEQAQKVVNDLEGLQTHNSWTVNVHAGKTHQYAEATTTVGNQTYTIKL